MAVLGVDDGFDQAIAEFAGRYADVNETDHARLLEAIDSGAIPVADEA